jgi:GT2 family glycosyltransferase
VRRLQHPRLEVVVHADSNTTADAAAFAAVRSQFPRTIFVHSANLHELRGYNKAALSTSGELLAFAQDDTLPPPTTAWVDALPGIFAAVPELAAVGLHRGGTSWLKGAENASTLGGWWCNASAASRAPQPPAGPLVFAAWLSLDPIVVRRAAFGALGGFDEGFSEPGAPAMGMEKDLVARLWRRGWSSAVLCPSKSAIFTKDCGAKGTAAVGGARDLAARTNRELLHRLHNKSVGRSIEAQVRARNAWLTSPDASAREANEALRTLWQGCVTSCPGLLSVAHKAAVANEPICRANVLVAAP